MLSNAMMQGVRVQVAQSALESFEFFANTVMGGRLSEELCMCVQDVVNDRADYAIRCTRPRQLAEALRAWLEAQGISVLTMVELPQAEILDWLQLGESGSQSIGAVSIDVQKEAVVLTWL